MGGLAPRRLIALATLGFLVAAVLWIASPAIAHRPIVEGEVVCDEELQLQRVTWWVANSETSSGTNRTMTIDMVTYNGPPLSTIIVGAAVPPDGSLHEDQTLPLSATGTLTLIVRADWDGGGPQNVSADGEVTLGVKCEEATTTSVSAASTSSTATSTTSTTTATTTTTTAATTTTTTTATSTTTTTAPTSTTTTTTPSITASVLPTVLTTSTAAPAETLPFTGSPFPGGRAGLALLVAGGIVLFLARVRPSGRHR